MCITERRKTFCDSSYTWLLMLYDYICHLEFSTVGLHFHSIRWDGVNLSELIFILSENVLSSLCIANHQLYCLQPKTTSVLLNNLIYERPVIKGWEKPDIKISPNYSI